MNTFRKTLLACLAVSAVPVLGLAAEPAAPAPGQDVEKRLEDARKRLDADAREVAELSGQLGRGFAFQMHMPDGGPPPRALLGVNIDKNTGDARGAHVHDVSPGSAAAEAGIKAGDVITSIGSQDLTKESDPGRVLVEKMREAQPDLKLPVGVLRDGRKLTFDVTPRPAPQMAMGAMPFAGGGQQLPRRSGMPGCADRPDPPLSATVWGRRGWSGRTPHRDPHHA